MPRTLPRILALILLLALLQLVSPVGHSAFPDRLAGDNSNQQQPGAAPKTAAAGVPTVPCGYDPAVEAILDQVTQNDWLGWVRQLSGEDPVTVGEQTVRIGTRYSKALFNGDSPAYDFVREQIAGWYPSAQIEEHSYQVVYNGSPLTWKNLILTIPGTSPSGRVVLLTAHLDSTTPYAHLTPPDDAPGADDNATGSAALLEAARAMQGKSLTRTLRLIWFTGEEQGLLGSRAFAASHDLSKVVGVINVDMIGYDDDNDNCFELHVGTLPQSEAVGQCFANAVAVYEPELLYEYKTLRATHQSDHASFWQSGVGAVLVLENAFADTLDSTPYVCTGTDNPDVNPDYHSEDDTVDKLNLTYAYDVARASLAAAFSLANPTEYYILFPMVKNEFNP